MADAGGSRRARLKRSITQIGFIRYVVTLLFLTGGILLARVDRAGGFEDFLAGALLGQGPAGQRAVMQGGNRFGAYKAHDGCESGGSGGGHAPRRQPD